MAVLKNVKVKWAKVYPGQQDLKYAPTWSVHAQLSPEQAKTLQAEIDADPGEKKPKIKEDSEGQYFSFQKKCFNGKGVAQDPIVVVDRHKNPFSEEIGNGSVCNIVYFIKDSTGGYGHFTHVFINILQVVDHIPYSSGGLNELDDLDGDTTGMSELDTPSEEVPWDDDSGVL